MKITVTASNPWQTKPRWLIWLSMALYITGFCLWNARGDGWVILAASVLITLATFRIRVVRA